MEKACIQNLALIVSEDCNLDCRHCMRGCKNHKYMSNEVIEATLSQCQYITNLCICGGEPLMSLEPLINIVETILKNKVHVDQISIITNGTIYKEEFINLLNRIAKYLRDGIFLEVSYDIFHLEEINRLHLKEAYIENIKKYAKMPYFNGLRPLNLKYSLFAQYKLFNEGNAANLDPRYTIDLRPIGYAMTYIGKNKHKLDLNGYCYIGPLVAISCDGNITECDASFINQQTKYNYGNVLVDSIVEVIKTKTPIITPHKYRRKVKKLAYDFNHYQK